MLQDLSFGKLENEFRNIGPNAGDVVLCFRDGGVLLKRNLDDTLELPSYEAVCQWCDSWEKADLRYIFRMQNVNYFLWMGCSGDCPDAGFHYESTRQLRQLTSKDVCFAVMTAWHLFVWYRNNRFCGQCGTPTQHDDKERMLRCPNCGNMIFPKI